MNSILNEPWLIDALKDSLNMLPFLIVIFFVIEFCENFYSDKISEFSKATKKAGPLLGSLIASFPQCGFSVIASTLYTKNIVTKGTLLAVYLATSDEAIPVIIADPSKMSLVLPILGVKIFIAIIAGYLIDLFLSRKEPSGTDFSIEEKGCCNHNIQAKSKKDLILHPIMHTLHVFLFILVITISINYFVHAIGGEENLGQYFIANSFWQPVITGLVGLIPNCAVSIAMTLLYLKGAIGFGAVISGLCSSAGLGLLVLLRKNESIKDTIQIILLLLFISIISGIIIQAVYN